MFPVPDFPGSFLSQEASRGTRHESAVSSDFDMYATSAEWGAEEDITNHNDGLFNFVRSFEEEAEEKAEAEAGAQAEAEAENATEKTLHDTPEPEARSETKAPIAEGMGTDIHSEALGDSPPSPAPSSASTSTSTSTSSGSDITTARNATARNPRVLPPSETVDAEMLFAYRTRDKHQQTAAHLKLSLHDNDMSMRNKHKVALRIAELETKVANIEAAMARVVQEHAALAGKVHVLLRHHRGSQPSGSSSTAMERPFGDGEFTDTTATTGSPGDGRAPTSIALRPAYGGPSMDIFPPLRSKLNPAGLFRTPLGNGDRDETEDDEHPPSAGKNLALTIRIPHPSAPATPAASSPYPPSSPPRPRPGGKKPRFTNKSTPSNQPTTTAPPPESRKNRYPLLKRPKKGKKAAGKKEDSKPGFSRANLTPRSLERLRKRKRMKGWVSGSISPATPPSDRGTVVRDGVRHSLRVAKRAANHLTPGDDGPSRGGSVVPTSKQQSATPDPAPSRVPAARRVPALASRCPPSPTRPSLPSPPSGAADESSQNDTEAYSIFDRRNPATKTPAAECPGARSAPASVPVLVRGRVRA